MIPAAAPGKIQLWAALTAMALTGCAGAHAVAGDSVFSVTARVPGPQAATLLVFVQDGWHLNREYPMSFDRSEGPVAAVVIDDDQRAHCKVEGSGSGILHLSFCDAARCRIEHINVDLAAYR